MAHESKQKENLVVSKLDDGEVQMTFVLPWVDVQKAKDQAIAKLSQDLTIPGFRKGKAPANVASSHIQPEKVVSEVISILLPKKIANAYNTHNITPIMYPKLELLHAHDNEDWEVRAITAQIPEIKLGDYKKHIKDALKSNDIWTPGKEEKPQEKGREELENLALRALLTHADLKLPRVLVEEESNQRLASLLSRLEKLGLSLESYLATQKKTIEDLKAEYAKGAEESLKLELILGKISEVEKIEVGEEEVETFSKVLLSDPARKDKTVSDQEKSSLRSILIKRKTIESLMGSTFFGDSQASVSKQPR